MDSFKDSVAFWATVVGTLTGVFGLFESYAWIAAIGALIASCSVGALIYAARQRALVRSAALNVGNRSIDSLNLASLQRRLNRSLVIQQAENLAVIDGEDLAVTWKCSGYCHADRETALEFSVDADANIPFDAMECVAFDLRCDPRRRHHIRPVLVGPDGISKKIAVPFLAPIFHREPFSVELPITCRHVSRWEPTTTRRPCHFRKTRSGGFLLGSGSSAVVRSSCAFTNVGSPALLSFSGVFARNPRRTVSPNTWTLMKTYPRNARGSICSPDLPS
jgi:hypothetical protein